LFRYRAIRKSEHIGLNTHSQNFNAGEIEMKKER